MTVSGAERAECLLERAEGFAVEATAGAMEQAALCLEAVMALPLPAGDLAALRERIVRVRRLIEEAGRLRLGWARMRAAEEAGYTASGEPLVAAPGVLEVRG